MSKSTVSRAKKRQIITKLIEKWRPRYYLEAWHLNHTYVETPLMTEDGEPIAVISVDPIYMDALIKTYPLFWTKSPEEQDDIIGHELAHCLTQDIWDIARDLRNGKSHTEQSIRDAVENLTQKISVVTKFGSKR